ncbi:glutaredoxin [Neobacillus cucumis]|uniref:glutaredoxin n=1 Tax=Neobacillus cucumis TaxID=1740721 RepID=UPI001962EA21|nr:glutaredoxin [Neobacillus cucumis]MBM7652165.1 glutaredoxin-related protein [Neobacillus cucumis]
MKVKVIGSHLCPDTLYALSKLKEKNANVDFQDLSTSFPALKDYLYVRENNTLYDSVREAGGIGIPFFEIEDGTQTLDLNVVLIKL